MKFSIITAVLNNRACIGSCLASVHSQTYPDIEHIIVDGGSTDGTLEIITAGNRLEVIGNRKENDKGEKTGNRLEVIGNRKENDKGEKTGNRLEVIGNGPPMTHDLGPMTGPLTRLISEPDRGIYDALNKGILSATGDVIGFLHADDVYADEGVLERVAKVMSQGNCDSCYGDLVYVKNTDNRSKDKKARKTGNRLEVIGDGKNDNEKTGNGNFKIVRYWRAGPYDRGLFRKGWMPPHPTFFVRSELYKRLGGFNTGFRISADYELMLRFLWKNGISACYIPEVLVRMRTGGVSNRGIGNIILKSSEDYRAMRLHGMGGLATLFRKNVSKVPQFFKKRDNKDG